LGEFEQVVGALLERAPRADLVAQPVGLAQHLLRGALVCPEAGFAGPSVELVDAGRFCG
jgi:hypothetical protein